MYEYEYKELQMVRDPQQSVSDVWHGRGWDVRECEKYDCDRMEIIRVILTEMGCEMNEVVDKTEGNKWGCSRDNGETSLRMINADLHPPVG